MKKAILFLLVTSFSMISFAQIGKDSLSIKGAQQGTQQEFVYERTDTAIVRVVLYAGSKGLVEYYAPGYVLLKGYQVKRLKTGIHTPGQNGRYADSDYQWQWTEQPTTIAVMDSKRQTLDLKKVIQLIQ